MTSYIRCFLKHVRYKAAAALAMMVLLGLLEGNGLLDTKIERLIQGAIQRLHGELTVPPSALKKTIS
jgi:hypothetical protein